MKASYQGAVILRVLICSERDLRPDLAATLIGRQGIEVYRVAKFADARLVGSSLGVQVILVDRDFPNAAAFIRQLRHEPSTRDRSIAVVARGVARERDPELLAAGANAIFPMPPDAGWDERFTKLLTVPVRQQARIMVNIEVATKPECPAAILNLSPGGMFLATHHGLKVDDEVKFRFSLPAGREVRGVGRIARPSPPLGYGVEFVQFEGDGKSAVVEFLRTRLV